MIMAMASFCQIRPTSGHDHETARAEERLSALPGSHRLVRLTLTGSVRQAYLDGMANSRIPVPGAARLDILCCSFCNKDKDAVAKLVAGPGVYICNECVELCHLVIADKSTPRFGAWNERPDDELLTGLAKVQAVVSQADAAVHDYVDVLRSRGISWTRIGTALGVSKQAAWERFSGED